jgi:hypothetical protein
MTSHSLVFRAATLQADTLYAASNDRSAIPAVIVCMIGFLAHSVLSDPLLNSIGFHYSNEGKFYEKMHPGSMLILLSFMILLLRKGRVLEEIMTVLYRFPVYSAFIFLYAVLSAYMGLRSGFSGLAFIIDIHATAGVAAIVLSYAPRNLCKIAVILFLCIASVNSVIAIIESVGRFRIFTFDPEWTVLQEANFRSSALMGHPLNNAMFTSVAVCIALAIPIKLYQKITILALLMTALVAFGGRAGITFSVLAILFYSLVNLLQLVRSRTLNTKQALMITSMAILIPVCLFGGLYLLLQTNLGERLVTHAQWDESADSRFIAFDIFEFLSFQELLFGVSAERIVEIAYRMNLIIPLSDIENPWLLMLLNIGLILFPFWLFMTLVFIGRLMWKQSFAIKLAVLAYFVTASTSNSFGRKDSIYVIMVCIVLCTSTLLRASRSEAASSGTQ